jgi:hypothetical protein
MSGVIDLNCEDYRINAGSINHDHDGYVFRCTISPVSEEVASRLIAAVQPGTTLRLVFPERPVLLERVKIERIDGASVRIAGRVIAAQTKKGPTP